MATYQLFVGEYSDGQTVTVCVDVDELGNNPPADYASYRNGEQPTLEDFGTFETDGKAADMLPSYWECS